MRFLSKKGLKPLLKFVVFVNLVACVLATFLSLCPIQNFKMQNNSCNNINGVLSVNSQSVVGEKGENLGKDETVFNLHYEGKTWTFYAKDFELDSKVFSLDARINNYNRNGTKQDKINLINKLIKINIPPEIAFNYIYLGFNNKINKIQKNIEKPVKNAEIRVKNNKINIKKEIIGIKLNKYLFYDNLIGLYKNNKIINLEIPVIKDFPTITSKRLKEETQKRAEFSTSISTSSPSRKHNIKQALSKINGTKLGKREKFSFNNCVGRRTAENGYREAKIILDGEFVEGVGGGVCQVSTTLYNAVLLSGLNVVSSQKHSQRVGYVKGGFDAMVNYGTSDLVFENNTDGDIYILCNYTNDSITISVYGKSLGGQKFVMENEIVNEVSAGEQEIIYDADKKYIDKVKYEDECFELKKARNGYTIKSYRLRYVDGVLQDKVLLRTDKYLPQHSVLVYGVEKRPLEINLIQNII